VGPRGKAIRHLNATARALALKANTSVVATKWKAAGTPSRLGVRGRLLLAFFSISGFAVLAAAAAMYSFLEVGKALETITERKAPPALASLELSRQAERIVAVAPTLLSVTTAAQHEELSKQVAAEFAHLNLLLGKLKNRDLDTSVIAQIETAVRRLDGNLQSLDRAVASLLAVGERKAELVSQLESAHIAVFRILTPQIMLMDARVSQLLRTVDDPSVTIGERAAKTAELAQAIVSLLPEQKAQVEASAVHDTLLNAAAAESRADLPLLLFPLHRSLEALSSIVAHLESGLQKPLKDPIAELQSLVDGQSSILAARDQELAIIADGHQLLNENADVSHQLTQAVNRLVATAEQDIARANLEARSVQRLSTTVLAVVVALSLVSSALIVWLYVGRNLITRLRALSDSMLAIAGGNLKTVVPAGGSDEISRMAEALAVFRATAIEVEEANLREIREARRRLSDAIESISEGFSLYDADDRLVLCNSRYRDLLYPGMADVLTSGTPFTTIIRHAAERGLIRDAEGRIDAWVGERLAQHRDPRGLHLQRRSSGHWIQISERKTEDGSTVAVYTDITELKQTEEAVLAAKDQAELASRAKSEFLANMSHELRTPLNAIIGFTRLVMQRSQDILPKKQHDNLEKVLVSAQHLLSLISTILDLSKIEAGRMEVRPVEFSLAPLVELCLRTVEPMVTGDRIQLARDIEPDLPLLVTDQGKLKQILMNLLSNAVKFTEAGTITVSARRRGTDVVIAVSDTGIGIPKSALDLVFEEFRQVDSGSTRQYGGTGLGLSISRHLARLMGGNIELESTVGIGSTFTVSLPLRFEDIAPTRLEAAEACS
jgi:adenylate cyclase